MFYFSCHRCTAAFTSSHKSFSLKASLSIQNGMVLNLDCKFYHTWSITTTSSLTDSNQIIKLQTFFEVILYGYLTVYWMKLISEHVFLIYRYFMFLFTDKLIKTSKKFLLYKVQSVSTSKPVWLYMLLQKMHLIY